MPAHPNQTAGGRVGGFKSWANTVDRAERTKGPRDASPGGIDYWLNRLDPERFADATDAQRLAAAQAAKKAHFAELAMKSAQARARDRHPTASKAKKAKTAPVAPDPEQ